MMCGRNTKLGGNSSVLIICLLFALIGLCSMIQPLDAKFSLKGAISKAKSGISSRVKSATSNLRGNISKVGGFVKKANSIKSSIERKAKQSVGNFVKKSTGKLTKKFNSNKYVKKAKQSIGKWKENSKKFKNGFKKFGEKAKNFKNGVKKFKQGAKKSLEKFKKSKFGQKLKQKSLKFKKGLKNLKDKAKNGFKKGVKKFGDKSKKALNKLKNSKLGKKIAKKVNSTKQKLRAAGAKVDKLFKNGKKKLAEKVKKVTKDLRNKVMKKLETLKKTAGKLKGTKTWKTILKAMNGAKKVIGAVKKSLKKDQTKGVERVSSMKKFKPNQKVSSYASVTAKTVDLASQMSNNAYDKNADKNLEKQGYEIVLNKDHKKDMVASKIYYNEKDKTLVVSYRGTVATSIKDWGNNLKIGLKPTYFDGKYAGKIHSGFLSNYMKDREEINKLINQYQKDGKVDKIVFTGHSKGGALGEIAATDYQLNHKNNGVKVELVTFGGPRVGDKKHAQIVNDNVKDYVRVVNTFEKNGKQKKDIVTEVPPQLFGYAHAGAEVDLGCQKSNGVSCHLLDNYMVNTQAGPQ